MKFKFNKKAAMELGISTVVMLVIAMVIIGGGIAFIRGFFKQGETQLSGAFDIVDFRVEPTRNEPLVLATGKQLEIKPGTEKRLGVGYYNSGTSKYFKPNITCINSASTSVNPSLLVTSSYINSGDIGTFEAIITAQTTAGYYVCNLNMYSGETPTFDNPNTPDYSTQIIMDVRN